MKAIEFSRIKLSPADSKHLAAMGASWRSVWPAIKPLDDSNENIEKLAKMIVFEMRKPEPRPQILSRLHMRVNAMRQRMEVDDIFSTAKVEPPVAPTRAKPAAPAKKPAKKAAPAKKQRH